MVSGCSTNCYNATNSLLQALTGNGYSTAINPSSDLTNPLVLYLTFVIIKTLALKNDGTISVAAGLGLSWNDPRLKWNQTQYNNLSQIQVPTGKIWMPTLALLNGVSENLLVTVDNLTSAAVYYNGNVTVNIARQFKASCLLDLTYFPFDSHNCTFVFQNYDLRTSTLGSVFSFIVSKVITDVYTGGGELTLGATQITNQSYCLQSLSLCFSSCNVTLSYSRNPNYYLTNVVFPSILLTFASSLVYLIPSDNSVKIAMACSLMVALYVLQQAIMRLLPATTNTPLCAKAIMAELGLGCFGLLCAVVTTSIRSLQPTLSPGLMRFLDRFEFILCQKNKRADRNQVAPAPEKPEDSNQNQAAVVQTEKQAPPVQIDKSDPLVFLVSELVNSNKEQVSNAKKVEAQKAKQAEINHYWKILDLLINGVLLVVYILLATLSIVFYQFGL